MIMRDREQRLNSHRLDIVIQEAIQAHADHYRHGALEMETILSALGDLAAGYIAEVPQGAKRQQLFRRLCHNIADAVDGRAQDKVSGITPIS